MRQPIIAGNWKMNYTIAETKQFIAELKPLVADAKAEVVLCVPFTNIAAAAEAVKGSNIKIGAQNVHWADKGAFTGEISADMLVELGVEYVIVGHSERRQFFGETSETVNKRAKQALAKNLKPIICVGETLAEREANLVEKVLVEQTTKAFLNVTTDELDRLVVAYEPVWAIGTGKTASNDDANDAIAIIRDILAGLYSKEYASKVRIQYGGSMNPTNATALMAMEQIDGGLIGGASLKAMDFTKVVKY